MNQSELIEKVAQATELNQAAAGHAVKAVVNAILDALLAGDAVRVSGLGIFNVAARPAREGRNPQTGETSPASRGWRFYSVGGCARPPPPKPASPCAANSTPANIPAALSYRMPRWPPSTSSAPSSTASGTTPSHQILIAQIVRLSRDGPLVPIALPWVTKWHI